jgi:hypothetical protein
MTGRCLVHACALRGCRSHARKAPGTAAAWLSRRDDFISTDVVKLMQTKAALAHGLTERASGSAIEDAATSFERARSRLREQKAWASARPIRPVDRESVRIDLVVGRQDSLFRRRLVTSFRRASGASRIGPLSPSRSVRRHRTGPRKLVPGRAHFIDFRPLPWTSILADEERRGSFSSRTRPDSSSARNASRTGGREGAQEIGDRRFVQLRAARAQSPARIIRSSSATGRAWGSEYGLEQRESCARRRRWGAGLAGAHIGASSRRKERTTVGRGGGRVGVAGFQPRCD